MQNNLKNKPLEALLSRALAELDIGPGTVIAGTNLLDRARDNYGFDVAVAIDKNSGPCPVCGLDTYKAVVCERCRKEAAERGWHAEIFENHLYIIYGDSLVRTWWWLGDNKAAIRPRKLIKLLEDAGISVEDVTNKPPKSKCL